MHNRWLIILDIEADPYYSCQLSAFRRYRQASNINIANLPVLVSMTQLNHFVGKNSVHKRHSQSTQNRCDSLSTRKNRLKLGMFLPCCMYCTHVGSCYEDSASVHNYSGRDIAIAA